MDEYFAVVVELNTGPDFRPKVFIAFPFVMRTVADLIDEALRSREHETFRIDFQALGQDFAADIIEQTRSCQMLVAVCTPEKQSKKPNPNVMYELGLADSLGRPTLAVTTDTTTLPADIHRKTAFTYHDKDLTTDAGKKAFKDRFINQVEYILEDVDPAKPFLRRGQDSIWVARADQRQALSQHFWEYAKLVVDFAQKVRGHFRFAQLSIKSIEEAAKHLKRPNDFAHCEMKRQWEFLEGFFDGLQNKIGCYLEEPNQISENVARLNAKCPTRGKILTALENDYAEFLQEYRGYVDQFRETRRAIDGYSRAPMPQKKPSTDPSFLQIISDLAICAKHTHEKATTLIDNLMNGMCECFKAK